MGKSRTTEGSKGSENRLISRAFAGIASVGEKPVFGRQDCLHYGAEAGSWGGSDGDPRGYGIEAQHDEMIGMITEFDFNPIAGAIREKMNCGGWGAGISTRSGVWGCSAGGAVGGRGYWRRRQRTDADGNPGIDFTAENGGVVYRCETNLPAVATRLTFQLITAPGLVEVDPEMFVVGHRPAAGQPK